MLFYLDCDGVLADFERGATDLLGMPPRAFEKHRGIGAFWRELARHPDFYGTLPLMPDAMQLFEAVRHLDPVILTGLPLGKWAAPQKVRWAAEHFPGTRILTVMAVDKRNHAQDGDILVDDQLKHAHLWEGAGGIFVHHLNADKTIAALIDMGVPMPGIRDGGISGAAPGNRRTGGRRRRCPTATPTLTSHASTSTPAMGLCAARHGSKLSPTPYWRSRSRCRS